MRQNLVFYQILRQLARTLISDLIMREVKLDNRDVESESRGDEFEKLVVDEVAAEIDGNLGKKGYTKFWLALRVSAISRASVNFIPAIFFL